MADDSFSVGLSKKDVFLSQSEKLGPPNRRILVVDDDDFRADTIGRWIHSPRSITRYSMVRASSAGAAIGILERDKGKVYSGIMLDYDLWKKDSTGSGRMFTGKDVTMAVIANVDKDVPVFVHSNNDLGGHTMTKLLTGAGFSVERIRYADLLPKLFFSWLRYVDECSDK